MPYEFIKDLDIPLPRGRVQLEDYADIIFGIGTHLGLLKLERERIETLQANYRHHLTLDKTFKGGNKEERVSQEAIHLSTHPGYQQMNDEIHTLLWAYNRYSLEEDRFKNLLKVSMLRAEQAVQASKLFNTFPTPIEMI